MERADEAALVSDKPQPYELWKQAAGDVARYMELLVEHRWVIRRELEGGLSDNERLLASVRRERCEWTDKAEPLSRRDCVHQGCAEFVEYGKRCLYFPLRRRAMCARCGEVYLKASE